MRLELGHQCPLVVGIDMTKVFHLDIVLNGIEFEEIDTRLWIHGIPRVFPYHADRLAHRWLCRNDF